MTVTVAFRLNRHNRPDLPLTLDTDEELVLETVPRKGDELMDMPGHFIVTRVMHRRELPPLCIVTQVQLPEPVPQDLRGRENSALG